VVKVRGSKILVAATLAFLLVGCAAESASGGDAESSLENNSLEVSRAEYEAAFDRFVDCAGDAGVAISRRINPSTGLFEYSYAEDTSGVAADCYGQHFRDVDIAFQTTDPTVVSIVDQEGLDTFNQSVKPCLEQNGYDVPAVPDMQSPETGAAFEQWIELQQNGLCSN